MRRAAVSAANFTGPRASLVVRHTWGVMVTDARERCSLKLLLLAADEKAIRHRKSPPVRARGKLMRADTNLTPASSEYKRVRWGAVGEVGRGGEGEKGYESGHMHTL